MKRNSVWFVLLLELAVITAVLVFQVMATGGLESVTYFIDTPSVICLLICVVPALLVSGMAKDFAAAFFVGKRQYSLAQMKKSLEAVKMVQRLVLCSMGLMVVISFVTLLHRLDDPSHMGPMLAVMVLTIFYGIIVEFLMIPISALVQNHITEAMDVQVDEVPAAAEPAPDNNDEKE